MCRIGLGIKTVLFGSGLVGSGRLSQSGKDAGKETNLSKQNSFRQLGSLTHSFVSFKKFWWFWSFRRGNRLLEQNSFRPSCISIRSLVVFKFWWLHVLGRETNSRSRNRETNLPGYKRDKSSPKSQKWTTFAYKRPDQSVSIYVGKNRYLVRTYPHLNDELALLVPSKGVGLESLWLDKITKVLRPCLNRICSQKLMA